MERFEFQVGKKFHRRRLDDFLFDRFREYSKKYLRTILKENFCQLNGEIANGGAMLRSNDFVEIELDLERAKAMRPQRIPLSIIYEDDDLIVINKASGILVHPTHRERDGTLLNGVTYHLNESGRSGFLRPLPVHRIDRDTSGVVVFALNTRASRIITRQLRDRKTEKNYVALVSGETPPKEGIIRRPITRDAERKLHIISETGLEAETRFSLSEERSGGYLLEAVPVTGRTNQIRVHFADAGFPIVGDRLYGGSEHDRLCLHARSLKLRHPTSNEWVRFRASEFNF